MTILKVTGRMLRTAASPWRPSRKQTIGLCLFAMAFACCLTLLLLWPPKSTQKPVLYHYYRLTASNGIELHVIKTSPRNVTLRPIAKNVSKTGMYGVNGGFFWNGDLLSIAVINNVPVKGNAGDYGTGWYNVDRSKGTLVWDDVVSRFSVQVAADPDGLGVTDRGRYWAQGGISMRLGDDSGWYRQAAEEGLPAIDDPRLRTAAVYDAGQNLWLVVTPTKATAEQFRAAVKERVAPGRLVDGIFLDGDGSSQLKVREATLLGDRREVFQMIALDE